MGREMEATIFTRLNSQRFRHGSVVKEPRCGWYVPTRQRTGMGGTSVCLHLSCVSTLGTTRYVSYWQLVSTPIWTSKVNLWRNIKFSCTYRTLWRNIKLSCTHRTAAFTGFLKDQLTLLGLTAHGKPSTSKQSCFFARWFVTHVSIPTTDISI